MTFVDEDCDICLMHMDECECGDQDEADEPTLSAGRRGTREISE